MKFREVSTMVFEIREWTDGQTDRHTDTLIAILRTPPGDEVTAVDRALLVTSS